MHGPRVGQADVFPGHAHHAARQVARVCTTIEHAAQPVQRCIGVRTTHGFVQRRDLVIKVIAAFVKTAGIECQRILQKSGVYLRDARRRRRTGRLLQQVEQAARVAVGITHQGVDRAVVQLQTRQLAGLRAAHQGLQLFVAEHLQHIDLRA